MKSIGSILISKILFACSPNSEPDQTRTDNPLITALNQPVPYASVTAEDIKEHGVVTLGNTVRSLDKIKKVDSPTFENVFVAFDGAMNELDKASSNCFMLYWVSPDSLSRIEGLAAYQLLDSLNTNIYADGDLFSKMQQLAQSADYASLGGIQANLVDEIILSFEHSGVNLDLERLGRFKQLVEEENELTSEYSINMNTANAVLVLDEEAAQTK